MLQLQIFIFAKMNPLYRLSPFFFLFSLLLPLGFSQLPETQISAMITLSQQIPNLPWNITAEPHPCRWARVTCSRPDNSSITQLSLSGLSLSSSAILSTVCKIESLQSLDLSKNDLASIPDGFITACAALADLKLLNFSRNNLVGSLPTFTGFDRLEVLDLSHNSLSGSIGLQLDGLVSLTSLNLSTNQFRGSVPINLGRSKSLDQLDLSTNGLDGEIPAEIADYRNLTMIDLSDNILSGILPNRLGALQRLELLVLSSNRLSGQIPTVLANIPTLSRFSANQNSFTGPIPNGITRFLKSLDLSYNRLTGTIPSDLLSPSSLEYLDLSVNRLEGSIPKNMSRNMLRLRLGSNSLNGTIPSTELATLDQLTYLELENNSLSGPIPAEMGLCRNLALLNLAQNELHGSLPPQLGNLSHLQVLKLQQNNLSGEIPAEIGHLTSLSQLNISSNSLIGPIPVSISNLRNLTILNLRKNNLSGTIPQGIRNLGSLLELQLGTNRFSGRIPEMPSTLQIALNLSNNLLEGGIPSTLSDLISLEILDLSNNNLSGPVPDVLTKMTSLILIDLSYNQLSGVLPSFRRQVEVDAFGNDKVIIATPSPPEPVTRKKRNSVGLAVLVALASAVLFAALVAVIVVSLSRRFYRVNDGSFGETEVVLPQVIQSSLLTANRAHRSSIDFTQAMETVSDLSNIISKTRFSTYYKCTMPSGSCYYIKKLNWSDKVFQLGTHERFGQELESLGKLNNSNVMTPLAYVLTADSAYLFYEYAQKGTLYDVLHTKPSELDWASRYSIAVGVAQGLAFLHDCSSGPVLLLDLSSSSILLKSLKEPQVGDIELCKVIDPSKSTGSLSTVAGSVGYIPPEYAYTMRITSSGNVYSFGVVLLELLTGKPAVSEGAELAKWVLTSSPQQNNILDFSVSRTSAAVQSQMLAVFKVALSCVSLSPEARPKMRSVLRMLLNAR